MTRAPRVAVALAAVVAFAVLYAAVPWSPFQDTAGPLHGFVPTDAEAVLRFDARALTNTPLWDRLPPALKETATARIGTNPSAAGDARGLLGCDTLAVYRDDEWLVAVRVEGPLQAARIALARATASGPTTDVALDLSPGDARTATRYSLGDEDDTTVYLVRDRDVFLLATDQDLLRDALRAPAGRDEIHRALRMDDPPGPRLLAWICGDWFSDVVELGLGDVADEIDAGLPFDRPGVVTITLDDDEPAADVRASWRSDDEHPVAATTVLAEIDFAERARALEARGPAPTELRGTVAEHGRRIRLTYELARKGLSGADLERALESGLADWRGEQEVTARAASLVAHERALETLHCLRDLHVSLTTDGGETHLDLRLRGR